MAKLDTREWLLTNGLGSFASGTVCDARTRTYHGWLIAALSPPSQRTLLLSHVDASLEVAGQLYALSTNFWMGGAIDSLGYQLLRSFEIEPVPSWIWGGNNWQLSRQLVMPYGMGNWGWETGAESFSSPTDNPPSKISKPEFCNRVLIQYRYEGAEVATLRLRPLIGDRDFHHQQSASSGLYFSSVVGQQQVLLQAHRPGWTGTPWQLRWTAGDYQPDGVWYWNYYYPAENRRGLGDREDLYSPGYLSVKLQPGDLLTLEARVGLPQPWQPDLKPQDFEQAVIAEQQRLSEDLGLGAAGDESEAVESQILSNNPKSHSQAEPGNEQNPKSIWQQLLRAGDQFIVTRAIANSPTVIAGYHWFNDWGRDTLIALPGLALTTGRFSLAKGLLEAFGRYCSNGLIPNTFPDADSQPIYNSVDASLWWIETLGLYLEATQDWDFLASQYPVVRQIYKNFCTGTSYNIHVDATDGLLTWDAPGVAITWMDAVIDGQPVTPRRGKAIEINALWYSALCWASIWAEQLDTGTTANSTKLISQQKRYAQQIVQVKRSLQKFWNPALGYFYDRIGPDDVPDASIRPNAVLALSLTHSGFRGDLARSVLQVARDRLLTPYGLRSLDPADPDYVGTYSGDRWYRDRAYHQGTVWSWLIGPFIRAWKRFYDSQPVPFDWHPMLDHFQEQACIGSISEIFDGDAPHHAEGAIAQAWSVAEIIRHYND
ncbi:glycogen debranching enzyme N-terminal domain-containing protein [Microcoleus sp. FACHB-831]|uniref:amylo-alpha-1,6-glucosidase n=1 Tax=Microcoleus sp. FACHB-831 TaxID=2692827 RepID=UPI001685DC67|nr:amylo-alpha-1,6-glucosidase [Microcoleus sp. FACHB-831]MBD1920123.1 glycogen debranching enzyme N-terminal domain-containing protein [Microcoleus sp. FACHB-831]